jgi:uncharacterized repeat protein (TIGR01451 family)
VNLPKLLRRLQIAAGSSDARGVRETLDALAENDGWAPDVENFIERLSGREASFIDQIVNPPGDDFVGQGGGDYRGGGSGVTGNVAQAAGGTSTTMTLALSDSPDPVNGGANITYTVTPTNTGSADATSVSIAVTLDATLAFVSAAGSGWTCGAVGQVVTCTRATMAAGAAPTIAIVATTTNADGTVSTSGAMTAANAPEADSGADTTTVVGQTTMTLALSDSPDPCAGGANVTYTVTATNTGTLAATTVSCAVTLDSSLAFVSAVGTGWTCGAVGQVVTCTRASMAAGAAPTIAIVATTTNATATISTSGSMTAANAPTASSGADTTSTVAQTTNTVTMTDSPDPVMGGKSVTYTVQATNTGGFTATTLSCAITIDASLTFVSSVGTGWSFSQSGQVTTATLASLTVGAANPITIVATTANTTASISSSASMTCANAPTASSGADTTQVNAVTKDATDGKYYPANATEWTTVMTQAGLATGNPASVWPCQEASGNLADAIGSITLTQTGTGHLYQQAVTGSTRKAVQTVDGTSGQKWVNTTTAPNPHNVSTLVLAVIRVPAASPAAARDVFDVAAAGDFRFNTTGKLRVGYGASADLTVDNRGTTIIVASQVNITGSVSQCCTSSEKLVGTYSLPSSAAIMSIGGGTTLASDCQYLYVAEFSGSAAELTAAQIKTLFQTLGYTISWS